MNEIVILSKALCYGSLGMHLLRRLPLLCCLASAGLIEPRNSGSGHEVATVDIQVPEEGMMDCRVLVENDAQMPAALVNGSHRHQRDMYP